MSTFKQRLREGQPLIGTLVTLAAPSVAEALSLCGFDWLWIDMEHAPLALDHVQQIIQSTVHGCAALVRVPANDEVWIKRVLDLGAEGIIVPQVKTAEEAQRAVKATKYPPMGTRSVGLARAHKYGMDFANHVSEANEKLLVVLQIEHIEAVQNIDSILLTPGVDAVMIGPYDLSGSFGKLGHIQDFSVQEAMDKVKAACKRYQMPIGVFALHAEQGTAYLKNGYQLVALGIDVHYLWTAAKSSLDLAKAIKLPDVDGYPWERRLAGGKDK